MPSASTAPQPSSVASRDATVDFPVPRYPMSVMRGMTGVVPLVAGRLPADAPHSCVRAEDVAFLSASRITPCCGSTPCQIRCWIAACLTNMSTPVTM